MFGGRDINILGFGGDQALDLTARIVRLFWPDAVFEDGDTGAQCDYAGICFGAAKELFCYRNAESIQTEGMIHIIKQPLCISLVIDVEPNDETCRIVAAIQDGLRVNAERGIKVVES